MWNQDVLQYLVLNDAVRDGDVGLMELLLPHMFIQFNGAGKGKYAIEVLELLQGLHKEWPDKIWVAPSALIETSTDLWLSDFAWHHCWLINTTGKPHLFCPIDQAQEHNIKDIKVTYHSEGPNIKWEYLKKLHPAINIICTVTKHIKDKFGTKAQGKSHTIPSKEKDILLLQKSYQEAGYHAFSNGWKITWDKDKEKGYTMRGYTHLHTGRVIEHWCGLQTFEHSWAERWGNKQESDSNSDVESD